MNNRWIPRYIRLVAYSIVATVALICLAKKRAVTIQVIGDFFMAIGLIFLQLINYGMGFSGDFV